MIVNRTVATGHASVRASARDCGTVARVVMVESNEVLPKTDETNLSATDRVRRIFVIPAGGFSPLALRAKLDTNGTNSVGSGV